MGSSVNYDIFVDNYCTHLISSFVMMLFLHRYRTSRNQESGYIFFLALILFSNDFFVSEKNYWQKNATAAPIFFRTESSEPVCKLKLISLVESQQASTELLLQFRGLRPTVTGEKL